MFTCPVQRQLPQTHRVCPHCLLLNLNSEFYSKPMTNWTHRSSSWCCPRTSLLHFNVQIPFLSRSDTSHLCHVSIFNSCPSSHWWFGKGLTVFLSVQSCSHVQKLWVSCGPFIQHPEFIISFTETFSSILLSYASVCIIWAILTWIYIAGTNRGLINATPSLTGLAPKNLHVLTSIYFPNLIFLAHTML